MTRVRVRPGYRVNTCSQATMTCLADKDFNPFSGDNLPTLLLIVEDIYVRNRETTIRDTKYEQACRYIAIQD